MQLLSLLNADQIMLGIIALLMLLTSAVLLGNLFVKLKMPRVIGEIFGGIILGPSVLGRLFPGLYNRIFFGFVEEGVAISLIYWLGLILLMFASGYEANIEDARSDKKIIIWLFAGSTIIPLIAGYLLSLGYFTNLYIGEKGNSTAFSLVFAIAVAITSLPVISKIFMDLGLLNHRYAKIILATAAIQDLILWVILSVAQSIADNGKLVISDLIFHIAVTALVFMFAVFVVPRIKWLSNSVVYRVASPETIAFLIVLLTVALLSAIGINIMYSSFIAGMIFKRIKSPETDKAHIRIKSVSTAFFVPVYFAVVGIRISVGSDFSVGAFLMFMLLASALELVGCVAAMRIIKIDWLSSINLGVAMNARGGPGIVLASVTYELGVINYEFFCALIFLVMISSAAAGYWIEYIHKRGKLLNDDVIDRLRG